MTTLQASVNKPREKVKSVNTVRSETYAALHFVAAVYAIYLSFKCNNGSINYGSLLVALLFPWLYIIYVFATRGKEMC